MTNSIHPPGVPAGGPRRARALLRCLAAGAASGAFIGLGAVPFLLAGPFTASLPSWVYLVPVLVLAPVGLPAGLLLLGLRRVKPRLLRGALGGTGYWALAFAVFLDPWSAPLGALIGAMAGVVAGRVLPP